MPSNPFVTPRIVRLPISPDDWIDVKAELTYGETMEMFTAMRDPRSSSDKPDPLRVEPARFVAWILAWSFVGPDGQAPDVTLGNVATLRPRMVRRIADVLNAHEARVDAEQEAEKNDPAGDLNSSASSPSAA
jgi:hypothetical protein